VGLSIDVAGRSFGVWDGSVKGVGSTEATSNAVGLGGWTSEVDLKRVVEEVWDMGSDESLLSVKMKIRVYWTRGGSSA
jgi:hypothetical protein